MIKKTIFAFILSMLVAFSGDGPYKDGDYTGTSRAIYTNEPYMAIQRLPLKTEKSLR